MGEVGDALWYTACSLRFAIASLAVVCVYRCCDRVTFTTQLGSYGIVCVT